jgi:hypothetical protein
MRTYLHKVAQRLVSSDTSDIEVQFNALWILEESMSKRPHLNELVSARSLKLFRDCLKNPASSTIAKQSVYKLITLIVSG